MTAHTTSKERMAPELMFLPKRTPQLSRPLRLAFSYRGLARVKQRLLGRHVSGQLSMAHIGSE